jgi:acetyl esterase/lipase
MEKNTLTNIQEFIARRFDSAVMSGNAIAVRLRREVVGATPQQIRVAIEGLARLNPGNFIGNLNYTIIAGVKCGVVDYQGVKDDKKRVVWSHGGGFSFGSARVYKATATYLAKALKCEVIIPEYRLAPEHKFPHGIDDLFAAYSEIVQQPGITFLIGDSAGGNLAACLVARCIATNTEIPAKLALLSPWMDLSKTSDSNLLNSSEFSPFDKHDAVAFARDYIGDLSDKDPLVSPLYGSFVGFPISHVQASKVEFLYTDSVSTVQALKSAGVEVDTHWEPKALHAWQLVPDLLPDAKRSMNAVANFFKA